MQHGDLCMWQVKCADVKKRRRTATLVEKFLVEEEEKKQRINDTGTQLKKRSVDRGCLNYRYVIFKLLSRQCIHCTT